MQLPVRIVNRVFHWGTMNPTDIGRSGQSHEGNCLSASLCPEAWQYIVRLGGSPLFELRKERAVFVDHYALLSDPQYSEQCQMILEDRLSKGYLKEQILYQVTTTDEEGKEVHFLCMTPEEATAEVEALDEALDDVADGEAQFAPVQRLVATDILISQLGLGPGTAMFGSEYGVLSWIKSKMSEGVQIDGVYQHAELDELSLVAPLFAIFPERIFGWQAENVPHEESDDDLMLELPAITLLEVAA